MKKMQQIPTEQEFASLNLSEEELIKRINSTGLNITEKEIGKRINSAVLERGIDMNYNSEYGYCPIGERRFYSTIENTINIIHNTRLLTINMVLLQEELIKKVNEYETNKEKNEYKQAKIRIFFQVPFFYDRLAKRNEFQRDFYILDLNDFHGETNDKKKEIEDFLGFKFNWN